MEPSHDAWPGLLNPYESPAIVEVQEDSKILKERIKCRNAIIGLISYHSVMSVPYIAYLLNSDKEDLYGAGVVGCMLGLNGILTGIGLGAALSWRRERIQKIKNNLE